MGTSALRYNMPMDTSLTNQKRLILLSVDLFIYQFLFISIYGVQNQKPNDEMQNGQKPYIKAVLKWN